MYAPNALVLLRAPAHANVRHSSRRCPNPLSRELQTVFDADADADA